MQNGKPDLIAHGLDEMSKLVNAEMADLANVETADKGNKENEAIKQAAGENIEFEGRKGKILSYFIPHDEPNQLIRMEKSPLLQQSTPLIPSFKSAALKAIESLTPITGKKKEKKKTQTS